MRVFIYFFIILSISTLPIWTKKNHTRKITRKKQILKSIRLVGDEDISLEVSEDFVREAIDELEKAKNRREVEFILTNYIDELFKKLGDFLAHRKFNPYPLPDIAESFDYMLTSGEIGFKNGHIQGLQTIRRGGAVTFSYDPFKNHLMTIIVPITFDELPFVYDYVAKIMKIGPHGKVRGIISKLEANARIQFNMDTHQAAFVYLRLENSENIEVAFSGYPIMDWVLNMFANIATRVVKNVILMIMEIIGERPIQSVIDSINDIMRDY